MAGKETKRYDYVQLHTHSKLSFLAKPRIAATATPEELVRSQLQKNYTRPSLTDTDVFYGAWRFDAEARKREAAPIIGSEQLIRVDETTLIPITIFPKSTKAFVALFDLYNSRVIEEEYMTKDDIEELSEDAIIITRGDVKHFEDMLSDNPNVFRGVDNAQRKMLEGEKAIDERFGKSVVTNEVRMASPKELENLRFQIELSGADQGLHASSLLHHTLKTPLEIEALYRYGDRNNRMARNQIGRTKEIAESINARLPRIKKFKAKGIPGNLTADEHLRQLVYSSLAQREDLDTQLQKRVDEEMRYITSMEFSDYIILCLDQVEFAKRNNFEYLVTGSGGQSVVLELLGMTKKGARNRDFTRFINPDREDLPDIDIKLSQEHRDDVKEYILNKYQGEALPLSVINHFKEEGILEEALRHHMIVTREQVVSLAEARHPKNIAKHQSGIVFVDQTVYKVSPDGTIIAQIERDDADKLLRIPKVDLLTDSGLSRLEYIKEHLRARGEELHIVPDDADVLRRIFEGHVLGITNLESPHMRNTLMMIGNTKANLSMQHIADALAIARSRKEARDMFYSKRNAASSPLSKYPEFVDILGATNMTVAFQDQAIAIAKGPAGLTGKTAEQVKKLASDKLSEQEKNGIKASIREGLGNRGYPERIIENVIKQLETITYGFLDGHASHLASESYDLAYFAHYKPELFWTAVFDNLSRHPESISSDYTLQAYANEAMRLGVTFAFPHPDNIKEFPRLHQKMIVPGLKMFKKSAHLQETRSRYRDVYHDLKNEGLSPAEKIHSQLSNLGISLSDVPIHAFARGPFFDPSEDVQWVIAHLESNSRTGRVILDSNYRIHANVSPYRVKKNPEPYQGNFWYVKLSKDDKAYYSYTVVGEKPLPEAQRLS